MRGKIAAVHRGDVARLERSEVARAVPVVEVAAVELEPPDRGQCGFEALGHLDGPDPPEVAGRHGRQQGEPDVGRRRPARDFRLRLFLKVVGREILELRAREALEIRPRLPRDPAELRRRRFGKPRGRGFARRLTHPAREDRRSDPRGEERRGETPGVRARDGHQGGRDGGEHERAAHAEDEPPDLQIEGMVRLRGRGPLEHVPPRDAQPPQRAPDRVRPQPGRVREQAEAQRRLGQADGQVRRDAAQEAALGDSAPLRQEAAEEGEERRDGVHAQNEGRPGAGTGTRQAPGGHEQRERRRRREAAPQVVEHLPARDGRKRVVGGGARRAPWRSQDPGQKLPVTADPSVLPRRRDLVLLRELLEELDVRDEPGAGEEPLEEIVGELGVLRNAIVERPLERVHVVDPLARVDPLAEQVLVDVRHREGVQIDPARTGEDELEEGAPPRLGEHGRHPRLEEGVPLDDARRRGVEAGQVEGMRDRSDQLPRRLARKTRVGVECDHVADAGGRRCRVRIRRQEGRVGRAAQQPVQLAQLAALALPSHPDTLGRVPLPPAMQNPEAVAASGRGPVASVQRVDRRARPCEQRGIPGERFGRSIRPIRQEREAQLGVRVGQRMHLQPADHLLDLGFVGQQHRDDDERAQLRRHAPRELELRQPPRAHEPGDEALDQRDGEVGGREEAEQRQQRDDARAGAAVRRPHGRRGDDREGRQRDRAEVQRRRLANPRAAQPLPDGNTEAEVALERRAALRDQVVTGVAAAGLLAGRRGRRHADGPPGHLQLVAPASPRQLLDGVAVPVPRRKIHLRHARPVAQLHVHEAHALEEIRPVGLRQQPHARDHVAHRRVIGDLLLVLDVHDFVGRPSLARQPAVEPLERRRDRGILLAQSLDELDRERAGEGRGLEHLDHLGRRGFGIVSGAEQEVGDAVRLVARLAPGGDALGEPAEILDEDDPQRDRQRPELADRQRLDPLVSADEEPERVELDPAVRVRDEGPRQPVDARIAFQVSGGELRQLPVEPRRKVLLDLPDLLLDDVEVVEQPVGGGRDRARLAARLRDRPVRPDEHPRVLAQPRQQVPPAPLPGMAGLFGGEHPRELLELLHGEELCPEGLWALRHALYLPRKKSAEPQNGLGKRKKTRDQAAGGDLTCRLLMTLTTPSTERVSMVASALTWALGTSPASVTTPLVTLMSMFTMFEKRSLVSFALTDAWMVVSSNWRPAGCVVEQAAASRASVTETARVRIPRVRRFMGSSDLSGLFLRSGTSGSIGGSHWTQVGSCSGDAASPSDQVQDDGDHRQHDEDVDEARRDVKREQTQGPENQ